MTFETASRPLSPQFLALLTLFLLRILHRLGCLPRPGAEACGGGGRRVLVGAESHGVSGRGQA